MNTAIPHSAAAARRTTSQTDLSKQNVTSRLTDPNSYPPAYKAKFEAIKKHKEAYKSSEKLSDKRTSSTNLSLKEAEVVKRLTDNGSKAKSRTSLERLEYTGYTNGFKPMDESEKEKLRAKGFANSNRIDFFSEFTPQGSRAGSRRASMIERNKPGADMAGSMGNLHSPDAPKLGGSSDSVQQTSAPKEQRKQSMTGLVEDMPPPRPPHELQKDTSYKRF
ncbi:hypothetical protein BC831DRAFT_444932 [Entophlyctis helioformis]|nr:hypothetical protein BC831DRAFT_444932 [Entophlyctis helioformis]